ncbi:MAG TPA: TIGR00730 family Rossman fold protein, partial [Gammaproteobacteria bacterium]|nr:TIGR00730 family Rossman fold protein [Gammaproteobacteria bacterium]
MEKIESAQMTKRTVAVYCGAGGKMSQELKQKAFDLGSELAKNGFNLVTGGANVGMMKEVVDGHMQSDVSAQRHGVLPSIFRDFEIQHPAILPDNMLWPTDVHGRLKSFYNLADDIVVMPGGFGTLHELMDCLVHIQFDLITKRTFLVNLHNFWDPILEQFEVMV